MFPGWLKALFSSRNEKKTWRRRRTLEFDQLEERINPAWTSLSSPVGNVQSMMLLADGSVMLQGGGDNASRAWYRLAPNAAGSYIAGSFTTLASMSLERLFFTSDVLPSGKVFVLGGEYSGPATTSNFNNTGEIYDPVANTWTSIPNFPNGSFGDDPSEVLNNGKVLVGYLSGAQTYLYDPAANTWATGPTKLRGDRSDEETWAKLPDGSILSYDVFSSPATGAGHAQRYVPSSNTWVDAGTVPVPLTGSAFGAELGPALMLPDGRLFQIGANNNTVLYNPTTNTWAQGPSLPANMGGDDCAGRRAAQRPRFTGGRYFIPQDIHQAHATF